MPEREPASGWSDDSGDEGGDTLSATRRIFDVHKITSQLVPEQILEITGVFKHEHRRVRALYQWSEVTTKNLLLSSPLTIR